MNPALPNKGRDFRKRKGGMKHETRYTITAIAEELGVTRQTIYYWIKKGWVAPYRDYRDYPVFTDKDLARIKKWHKILLKKVFHPPKQDGKDKPSLVSTQADAHFTWEEMQRMLYTNGK